MPQVTASNACTHYNIINNTGSTCIYYISVYSLQSFIVIILFYTYFFNCNQYYKLIIMILTIIIIVHLPRVYRSFCPNPF